jgi:excisionase family DNA binding protein
VGGAKKGTDLGPFVRVRTGNEKRGAAGELVRPTNPLKVGVSMATSIVAVRNADGVPLRSEPARLVSIAEAARALSVSPRFIRMLAARGGLQLVRLGRRALVARAELDRLAVEGAP